MEKMSSQQTKTKEKDAIEIDRGIIVFQLASTTPRLTTNAQVTVPRKWFSAHILPEDYG